jgi:hypothetical protein
MERFEVGVNIKFCQHLGKINNRNSVDALDGK